MLKIKNIVTPRKEVLDGVFQGVIHTHKVDSKESRIENNPKQYFDITYPSLSIKRSLERISEKLIGKSNQGGFLLVGPYGSGKSHNLITLYHLFDNPSISKNWGKKWVLDFESPKDSKSIIISTRRYDVDFIWEPIFRLLGKEDLLKEVKRFPTVDQIEELIGDEVLGIFIDEIENWYGSFDPEKQAHIIEQNETFLEHLFEVANDQNKRLFVFITFLEEKEGLKKIFNRTKPVRLDVSSIEDREKIILFRLFEDVELIDEKKCESIVSQYVGKYTHPIKIDNPLFYKQRMMRTYPFHPLLIDSLIQIYEAAAERQDIRGMMNVLADVTKDLYEKKDLIMLNDIDENAFRGIDLSLVEKYSYDLERTKDIGFSKEILKTILIFTLNDKTNGATEFDILLSIYSPSQGHTTNEILMDLENIYGKAHYLHKDNDIYIFKHDINIFALVEREQVKISDDDVKDEISKITKEEVFENRAFVFGYDEIPEDSKVNILVSLETWGTNEEFKRNLNDFHKGKTWQNSYILVFPECNTISTYEVSEKAKRLVAAEKLREHVDDEKEKLNKILREEREGIKTKIKDYYGHIVKWVERDSELVPRIINVNPDINDIREKAGSDSGLCGDFIVGIVKNKADGIRIENLINDFKKFRKYPFILDGEIIYSAIRNLHRDKRVIIQAEKGRMYIDELPKSYEPEFVILDPKYAPTPPEAPGEPQEPTEPARPPGPGVERKEKKVLNFSANSPRVILSQVETRSSEKDEFEEISTKYHFKENISKQEMMKFVKQLPHKEEAEIETEVIIWREKNED